MPQATPLRVRMRIALHLALLLACPALARAQAFTWQVPAGGETWTKGTTHTVVWSGGPVSVNTNVQVISLSPYQVAGTIALNHPYSLPASWTIPAGLAPGSYQLYVEDVTTSTWAYSATFTIQNQPPCATGCLPFAIAREWWSGYPATSCGTDAATALNNAQSWMSTQLAGACAQGFTLDPSSVIAEYTYLPVGSCYAGQFGAFQVEATAVGCCCSAATDATRRTWGTLKLRYR